MSKFNVKIGELNNIIAIGKNKITKKNGIIQKEEFIKEFQIHAKINHLLGSEFWSAYESQKQRTEKFIVRYTDKITYNHIIQFKNNLYEIIDIDNVDYRNEWIVIKATLLVKDSNL